ncbi:hypothetical protein BJX70DRAFT_170030 [Aspergillus crustosus]
MISSNAEIHEGQELDTEGFKAVAISCNKLSSSCARLSACEGLSAVKKAWATTLSRLSSPSSRPSFREIHTDESITMVQVSLGSESLPLTPPTTPCTTLSRPLLEQTIISYTSSATEGNMKIPPQYAQRKTSQSKILIEVVQDSHKWQANLWYKCGLVKPTQAKELVELLQKDLETVLQDLVPVPALPPSPPAETSADLAKPYQLPDCSKVERCIHKLVEDQVAIRSQQEAVCAHDGSLSYLELSCLSSRLAHMLSQSGACPEQRVAVLISKSRWYPVAVLAVLKAGAAFVPLDPNHPENRLRQLVSDIEPTTLITTNTLYSRAENLGCHNLLAIDEVNLDEKQPALSSTLVNPDNAAYIIFTSGSTGKPKGVVVEHSALATSAVMRGAVLGLGPESRVLQYAPHTFDVSVDEILTTWIHGGCVCIPSESDRFMIAQFMESAHVTAALLTPTSARTLNPDDVPTLKTLQTGGEVLTEDVNDKWCDRVTLFNVYGPTEASIACVISNRTGLYGTGHVLGRAVGGACWVVDIDDISERLPPGEVGELVIAGPILARGYFRDPVRTETSFVRLPSTGERVYKTGDLASMSADGIISYHGRKDLEIKIRGQRINIAEVEQAVLKCDLVQSVIVEYPRTGPCAKRLTAVVCAEKEPDIDPQFAVELFSKAECLHDEILTVLRNHVSSVLPTAMVPSKWLALPYLPQTASAKVDRKQVRGWLEELDENAHTRIFHSTAGANISTPSDGLTEIWSKVLKVPPQNLRLDQSFIRNGGDSIMAMEARHSFREAGLVIQVVDLLGGANLQDIGRMATSLSTVSGPVIMEDTDRPFALSPVQQMYFDTIRDPGMGVQQRVSVEIVQTVQPHVIRTALNRVVKKHRMLAAQFVFQNGSWMQYIPSNGNIEIEPLVGFYYKAAASLTGYCTEKMSIENGPLLHAHLHSPDGAKRVLTLCAHHLVVDFVSWRVVLHDLHAAIDAAKNESDPDSHTRSTLTFQQWCREQARYAASLDPKTVLPFALGPEDLGFWQPANTPKLANTYAEVTHRDFRLSSAQTAQFLNRFTKMPSVHPTDILIAAFAVAFRRIFPERDSPNVFVENHGREPWQPLLDVSRTVGWFTAAYPIHLPKETLHELRDAIKAASERRQATPANGHPYWACRYLSDKGRKAFGNDKRHQQMEVVLNYAGSVVQTARDLSLFGDSVHTTEVGHPDCQRFSLFDITVSIEQPAQELVIAYGFPRNILHQDRIQELLQTHHEILDWAVEDDISPSLNYHQSVSLNPGGFDIASLLKNRGVCPERDVEAIYAASPIQQRMLQRQSLEPWYYWVRGTWSVKKATELSPPLDLDRLAEAWCEVVSHHAMLRTVYQCDNESDQYVAVVLRETRPSITRIRAADAHERSTCRDAGSFVLPHRMVLHEMNNGDVECELEFSHVIIDATSRSIVLQDLVDAYEGKLQNRTQGSPAFWKYIALIELPEYAVDLLMTQNMDIALSGRVNSLQVKLDCPTMLISEACKENEITISSFFMTAWAVVLSQHFENQSVAFDYVQSDRSADILGIEKAVGPYIRLPSCEAVVTRDVPVIELAQRVHARRTCFQGSGLILPSKPTALQKYATLVNIRNSGTDSLDMTSEHTQWNLKSFDDPWDYDLVFAVNVRSSQVLGCTLEYAEAAVPAAEAWVFADSLRRAVAKMVQEMM